MGVLLSQENYFFSYYEGDNMCCWYENSNIKKYTVVNT